ncbi:MAG: YicC family protein [Defluviitaleaceae bacterium]|nr:YicC family protein [Defluviitaleaceae bacterium]MCL2275926.1 YicC family protein [Defluviitaleaceae bacterium]
MPKSMTGFGRGECQRYDRRFKIEIKSVNHRYGDFSIRLPRFLNAFEDKIRKRLAKDIARGKVEVWVGFDSYTERDITARVNWTFADAYVKVLEEIREKYGWTGSSVSMLTENTGNTELELLARNPDVVSFEKFESAYNNKETQNEFEETLFAALEEALTNFNAMRKTEGDALANDIREKQANIQKLTTLISERAPAAVEENAQKLKERAAELLAKLSESTAPIEIAESRFLTEIALLADRSAIDEELTRLASHLTQLDSILEETEPIGRKLDFLVQELNREANTIGSKSTNQQLGKWVVELKSEVEKIREQVQNIE